jgi:hypothetical protein
MTRDEAMLLILREWYALPESERETEHHAAVFALKIQGRYSFRSSGDKYQMIMGWLRTRLSK